MPRLPYEKWLAYLLASELTPADAVELVTGQGFIAPTEQQLAAAAAVAAPILTATTNTRRRLAARDAGIIGLVLGGGLIDETKRILGKERCRRALECLLLAGVPDEAISGYVQRLTDVDLHERCVTHYKHYFWNTADVPFHDWVKYLAEHPDGKKMRSYMTRGPEFTLWKLGYAPEVATATAYKVMHAESYMRFKELGSYANSQDTALAAKMWSEIVFKASEQLNQSGDQIRDTTDKLREVTLRFGRREISSIDTLEREPQV